MKLSNMLSFKRNEAGGMTLEAVLVIPMLVWAITATLVFWDAFRTINVSQKATYTIADMLSRETSAINDNYMTAVHEVYDYLSNRRGENAVRVTVVTMTEDPITEVQELQLVWSEAVGGIGSHTDIAAIANEVPEMATGDQLIVVESEQSWSPTFGAGLSDFYRFRRVAITRPRFAPQLVWDNT